MNNQFLSWDSRLKVTPTLTTILLRIRQLYCSSPKLTAIHMVRWSKNKRQLRNSVKIFLCKWQPYSLVYNVHSYFGLVRCYVGACNFFPTVYPREVFCISSPPSKQRRETKRDYRHKGVIIRRSKQIETLLLYYPWIFLLESQELINVKEKLAGFWHIKRWHCLRGQEIGQADIP